MSSDGGSINVEAKINESNRREHEGRATRLDYLLSIQTEDYGPYDALALAYYEEARLCWYNGAYVATIVMSQLALEEMLRAHYRVIDYSIIYEPQNVHYGNSTFYQLTQKAETDHWLTPQEARAFHKLRREFRNPFVHPRDTISPENEPNRELKNNFLEQTVKIYAIDILKSNVMQEAQKSLTILCTLFPRISRRFWEV